MTAALGWHIARMAPTPAALAPAVIEKDQYECDKVVAMQNRMLVQSRGAAILTRHMWMDQWQE